MTNCVLCKNVIHEEPRLAGFFFSDLIIAVTFPTMTLCDVDLFPSVYKFSLCFKFHKK